MLRNGINLLKPNMYLMLYGMQMSFTYCILITKNFLIHAVYELRWLYNILYISSIYSEKTDSAMLSDAILTAMMGQSRGCQLGLLMSTPPLFPFYFVAFTGELFSMVEKIQKSPACHDEKSHHFSSLFRLRCTLQNMFFKLCLNNMSLKYFFRDYV